MLTYLILSIFTFVELNCENLFDAKKDSIKDDAEYTAESQRRWTRTRYWDKLNNIAKEIISCGEEGQTWSLPDLVALCEVENDTTMHDLTRRSLLRNAGYQYVMTNSPDLRGIDVALMYNPYTFKLINSHPLRINPLKNMRPTRDILYASGQVANGDTLHVFVAHAPSKFGGNLATRPFRMLVAQQLNNAIDSIRQQTPHPNIIIAGDFNDNTDSPVLQTIIANNMDDVSSQASGSHGAKGTYKYKGRWDSIDHILISRSMQKYFRSCTIHDAPFLLEKDNNYGGVQPRRNYRGYKYLKGYSDHLPLTASFEWSVRKDSPSGSCRDESPNHLLDE